PAHPALPSFPTRRSSDLITCVGASSWLASIAGTCIDEVARVVAAAWLRVVAMRQLNPTCRRLDCLGTRGARRPCDVRIDHALQRSEEHTLNSSHLGISYA